MLTHADVLCIIAKVRDLDEKRIDEMRREESRRAAKILLGRFFFAI